MTLLAGVADFEGNLQLKSVCSRVLNDQGANFPNQIACERAVFGASPEGLSLAHDGGDHLLAADVRLDNRSSVERALAIAKGASDTDLLLAAWGRWGARALEVVVGDFAFAVFSSRSRKLTLVRDSAGERPLFYRYGARGAAFASLPHGLRSLGPSPIDLQFLADRALQLDLSDSRSYFREIYRVGVGEIVEIGPQGCTKRLWWRPRLDSADFAHNFPQPVEAYRSLLDEAVRSRLTSTRPIATHLSSGFDSSAVTATAARLARDTGAIVAYTAVPSEEFEGSVDKGRIADESEAAAIVAHQYGAHHIRVAPRPDVFKFVREQGLRRHEPIFSPFNNSWWADIAERAGRAGANVLLTGQMGNISLNAGGYAAYSDYVLNGNVKALLREIFMGATRDDMSVPGVVFNSFQPWIPRALSGFLQQVFVGRFVSTNSFLRDEWRNERRIRDIRRRIPRTYAAARNALMRTNDAATTRKYAQLDHGLLESDPTADRRIVEFSLRLPPEHMLYCGRPRPLAREALSDRLPPEILNPRLRGVQSADWYHHLTQDKARKLFEEIRCNDQFRALFDIKLIENAIERWPTNNFERADIFFLYGLHLVSALVAGIFLVQDQSRGIANAPSLLD